MARLLVGNWKMNGRLAANQLLLDDLLASAVELQDWQIVLCPPAVYLMPTIAKVAASKITVGSQDVSLCDDGAHTGDVSAAMLADIGCRYVIIGHSERRVRYGENDAMVGAKLSQALAAGLQAIICVGEDGAERMQDRSYAVVGRQLDALSDQLRQTPVIIAYEPVWAIGTGKSAEPGDVAAMLRFIRERLGVIGGKAIESTLIYGGSVTAQSAGGLRDCPGLQGFLVGGASLHGDKFIGIARSFV